MTDDLTRGYEGQEDITAESAESTQESPVIAGSEGSPVMVGQATGVQNVARPASGQTVEIQAQPGETYNLDFAPGVAQVLLQGENFVLAFDDDGDGTPDSQIVFLDLVSVSDAANPPVFTVAGVTVGSDVLVNQAQALAGTGEIPLDTAAGQPGALGGGGSEYNDDLGSLIDLLTGQDGLGGVLGESSLLGNGEFFVEEVLLFGDDDAPPPLLINEIGLSIKLAIPDLPGEETPGDDEETTPASIDLYGGEEELEEYNFVELLNNGDEDVTTEDLTVEILNPDGEVATFAIPDGITIPAGGFIVFYQLAEGGEEDDSQRDLAKRLSTLTPQQVRVLMMLSEGLLNKQIAYELRVSEATVKAHVSAILQKLNVDSRTQAVIAAARIESGQWQALGM